MAKTDKASSPPPTIQEIKALTIDIQTRLPSSPLVIEDSDHYVICAQLRADLLAILKEMEEKRMAIARPINAGLKKLKEEVDAAKAPLEKAEIIIKRAMLIFTAKEEAARDAQRKADQMRHTECLIEEAERTGFPMAEIAQWIPEPAPLLPIPRIVELRGGGTMIQSRTQAWRRLPDTTPPWEWNGERLWMVDEAAIWRLRRKAGESLTDAPPGIEFYYTDTLPTKGR